MKKSGFTMIELIFVIVIIGILAAVAVPKLMATRTDAKVATISQEASSIISEVPAYVVSQGKVSNISDMSQVAAGLINQSKAYESNTAKGDSSLDGSYSKIANSKDYVILGAQDDDGDLKPCLAFDVNSTTFVVADTNNTDTSKICDGVRKRIAPASYTIAGTGVNF